MASDRGIKALIVRVAKAHEDRYKDGTGAVDKVALTEFVLDYLDREDPDLADAPENEGARFLVWEAIRGFYRSTRAEMGRRLAESDGDPMQPKLPDLGEIERITLTVPAEDPQDARPKLMLDCALWEVEMVEEDYAKELAGAAVTGIIVYLVPNVGK